MSLIMVRDKITSIISLSKDAKDRGSVNFILLFILTPLSSLLDKYSMLSHGRIKSLSREAKDRGSVMINILLMLQPLSSILDKDYIILC